MRSETAMKLIGEINKLPDVLGEEDGKYAYEIELVYYDENSEKQFATKCGFDGFPDNWGTIVSYANEITPDYLNDGGLTDSTDIVTVDKDFLKANFDFSEDMLPDGVTAEQFIEEAGLTYEKISSSFRMDRCVREFKYAYYDFVSHRIKKDTRPSPSDMDSLKQYAEKNLDSIDSYEEYSVRGRFKDGGYEIVRFDCFEEWKREKGVTGDTVNPKDETLDIFYECDAGMEDMKYIDDYFVYVDPSNRFLIITQCIDYDLIKEIINRT